MTAPLPAWATPAELASALPLAGPAFLARARAQAARRPIEYPYGSGHADEAAVAMGFKPVLRQLLAESEIEAARARFEGRGLSVTVAPFTHFYPGKRALFAGRDARRVEAAAAQELLENADRAMGELLGYPPCCVEAYLEVPPPRPNIPVIRNALARTEGRPVPRLNLVDLAVFHFVSFFPCSFVCDPALRMGSKLAIMLRIDHPRFVQAIEQALTAHRLVALEKVQVSMAGRFDGDRVWIERAWPTCRDRHPNAPRNADEEEAAARLCALVEEAGSAAVRDGVIFAGDRAVARTEEAMIVPFGPGLEGVHPATSRRSVNGSG